VFIGLESINPESLKGASKGQGGITEYSAMLQAWGNAKVFTFAGYIIGFPGDPQASIERDILGSKDQQVLYSNATPMDTDVNRYDTEHVTTAHCK
jgi:hypothetical protein